MKALLRSSQESMEFGFEALEPSEKRGFQSNLVELDPPDTSMAIE
jgi:hypothetical protein